MFKDLTDELLDLTVVEKGFGGALYGRWVHSGGGGCASSSACCCTVCIWC